MKHKELQCACKFKVELEHTQSAWQDIDLAQMPLPVGEGSRHQPRELDPRHHHDTDTDKLDDWLQAEEEEHQVQQTIARPRLWDLAAEADEGGCWSACVD